MQTQQKLKNRPVTYLHRSCKPLLEAVEADKQYVERNSHFKQLTMIEECEGMCGY